MSQEKYYIWKYNSTIDWITVCIMGRPSHAQKTKERNPFRPPQAPPGPLLSTLSPSLTTILIILPTSWLDSRSITFRIQKSLLWRSKSCPWDNGTLWCCILLHQHSLQRKRTSPSTSVWTTYDVLYVGDCCAMASPIVATCKTIHPDPLVQAREQTSGKIQAFTDHINHWSIQQVYQRGHRKR